MGFNADNMFVKTNDSNRLSSTIMKLMPQDTKWKIVISPPVNNWIQIINSNELSDLVLAKEISTHMQTSVIVAQLYEVTGDIRWHYIDQGQLLEKIESTISEDPTKDITSYLRNRGVNAQMQLFRNVVKSGWNVIQSIKRN